jgi:hypothetical protein
MRLGRWPNRVCIELLTAIFYDLSFVCLYRTDITEQQLRGAPAFSRERSYDWSDRNRERELHDYYGVRRVRSNAARLQADSTISPVNKPMCAWFGLPEGGGAAARPCPQFLSRPPAPHGKPQHERSDYQINAGTVVAVVALSRMGGFQASSGLATRSKGQRCSSPIRPLLAVSSGPAGARAARSRLIRCNARLWS